MRADVRRLVNRIEAAKGRWLCSVLHQVTSSGVAPSRIRIEHDALNVVVLVDDERHSSWSCALTTGLPISECMTISTD